MGGLSRDFELDSTSANNQFLQQIFEPQFKNLPYDEHTKSFTQDFMAWVPNIPSLALPGVSIGDPFEASPPSAVDDANLYHEAVQSLTTEAMTGSESSLSDTALQYCFPDSEVTGHHSPNFNLGSSISPWQAPQNCSSSNGSGSSVSPYPLSDGTWMSSGRRVSHIWTEGPGSSLSPFSIDQTMIARSNNHSISANLFRIYHDVLEHNLSCWLTEVTCPYRAGPRSDASNAAKASSEWGASWSNRIYQRTVKLDRVAQSAKFLQLSRSEDQAASRALHLAIMAFATQWAQGSHRHQEKYPTTSGSFDRYSELDELADGISDEFDRNLQQHFWDKARRALQDVADLESYRVACAELIFGLTQKPWDPADHTNEQGDVPHLPENDGKFTQSAVLSQVRGIMRKEGPPIYMERAARKMHALKYRSDSYNRGLTKLFDAGDEDSGAQTLGAISGDDRSTIGLLYWLAIMFDTVSSSMNERPVVVLDEDCQHEETIEHGTTDLDQCRVQGRWNMKIFIQGDPEETHHSTHWPCSYELAAEDVTKSAPIKVLLFRHVSYLQNTIRKGGKGEQVEEIIRSTTSLYRYWNRTHGAFFRELVHHHESVPQRISGWFVCISAHWHLAALMFAELLDFVDENSLGLKDAAHNRLASKMAIRIRGDSAKELSDLARVATPASYDAGDMVAPQMPDFHHAVNEGTILTEPWTMILIRAFTKASIVFFAEADDFLQHGRAILGHNSEDFIQNLKRAENCIKGLWLLGKKSDMARKIAETLSLVLWKLRSE